MALTGLLEAGLWPPGTCASFSGEMGYPSMLVWGSHSAPQNPSLGLHLGRACPDEILAWLPLLQETVYGESVYNRYGTWLLQPPGLLETGLGLLVVSRG